MKKFLLLLIVFSLGLAIFSCKGNKAENSSRVIKIATDATWPPMEYIDENNNLAGFDIDLMNEAAEAAGYKIEIIKVDWDGIFAGLANGQFDAVCSAVTITENRKAAMDFSLPYINAGQVLIIRSDNRTDTALADMKGKEVGAQIDTTGAIQIQSAEGVILKNYEDIAFAFGDLANSKISGVVADVPIAANFVLRNAEYKNKLKIVGEPFTDEFYGVAVKKGNQELLDLINTGLMKVRESGKNQELINKWLR